MSVFRWKPSPRALARIGAGIGVVLVLVTGVVSYRSCLPGFAYEDGRAFAATLEPTATDSLGVAPDSAFILTLAEPVPLGAVRDALTISPEVAFEVRGAGGDGTVFEITPETPLFPDTVYQLRLNLAGPDEPGYSWAYQVRGDLRVVSTIPGNQVAGVPVHTGIELHFSHPGVVEPGPFFTIDPFVPGRWEQYRRTWVYVPTQPLQPGTIYTCRVKAGLGVTGSSQALAADHVFAFETEAIGSALNPSWYFQVYAEAAEFPVGQEPFFSVAFGHYGGEGGRPSPSVGTAIYRYRDAAAFAAGLGEREGLPWWASAARETFTPNTAGLVRVAEAILEVQTFEWREFVTLPEALPAGYYLGAFTVDEVTRYVWFQVTDLSNCLITATDETVLWFNDLGTGAPVAGVTVRALGSGGSGDAGAPGGIAAPGASAGTILATSSADGLARFDTPAVLTQGPPGDEWGPLDPYYVSATAPGGQEVVIDLSPRWGYYERSEREMRDDYWSYLFTDRPLYLPSDEVHFWGLALPLERGARPLSEVFIELDTSYYSFWDGPFGGRAHDRPILTQVVQLPDGTFTGSLRLPNLRPGYYSLSLTTADGVVLRQQGFEVATYTKPAYQVSATADLRAVFAGDPVTFRLNATFFEGTPVAELRFNYSLHGAGSSKEGTLTTGPDGQATYVHRPAAGTDPFRLERTDSIYLSANFPESGYIAANTSVRVFERDVALRGEVSREGEAAALLVRLNRVTLDRLNAGPDAGGPVAAGSPGGWSDYLGDPVAGRAISGQLFEKRWVAEETGEFYDFIEKVVRKTYNYREVRDPLQSFSLTTAADGTATWSFVPDPAKSYVIRYDTVDDAGRAVAGEYHVNGRAVGFPDDDDWHWYRLALTDREEAEFDVGETVNLRVQDRGAEVLPRTQSFLFYTARRGLDRVEVADAGTFSFEFEAEFIPNTNAGGVYFDGRSYHWLYAMRLAYQSELRRIDVTVTPDQASYRPGDTATVSVETRDADGRPVAAEVNLCLVDEALFALSGQEVDLLGSLYGRHIDTYIIHTRASHPDVKLMPGGGAECGGEGGGERRDFRDTALFLTLDTGGDGRASAEFELPDNLTSWRLTYQAFHADTVRAGSGTVNIPVRLPFFVELSLNQTYLAGDQPRVLARAYGTSLTGGAAVTFTGQLIAATGETRSELSDPAIIAEFSTDGQAFQPVVLDLGRLAAGKYELRVTGRATGLTGPDGGELTDTLVLPLEVVDTYLRADQVEHHAVTEGLRLQVTPGEPAELVFSDAERSRHLALLWRLAGGGRRVDMKLSALTADHLLKLGADGGSAPFAEPAPVPDTNQLAPFQREGGIALLPYASPDLELTAKAAALEAALGTPVFDHHGLLSYLGGQYEDPAQTRERFIVALYGLAALGEPVLNELRALLGTPDLSLKERLYLSLALIESGDEETARGLLAEVLNQAGDRVGQMLRLRVSADPEEIVAATSLAAVIAARLQLPDQGALFDYLVYNVPWEELNHLELSLALLAAVPRASTTPVAFTLEPDGERVTLKPGESYSLLRGYDDLQALRFSSLEGNVGVTVRYRAPLDPADLHARDEEAKLTRSYYVDGRETTSLRAGELVKVVVNFTIEASAPEGPYQVVDFLPSGLKVVPRPYELGVTDANLSCPVEVDGQRVTFNVFTYAPIDPKTGRPVPQGGWGQVTYYARVVSLGQYQADPAVLQHVSTGVIFTATGKAVIEIQ